MSKRWKNGVALLLTFLCIGATGTGNQVSVEAKTSEESRVPEYRMTDSYAEYLSKYENANSGSSTVTVTGAEYSETEDMDVTVDGDTVLTGNDGGISWDIEVETAGFYQIDLEYAVVSDGGNEIQFNVLVNGEIPFAQAAPIALDRMYTDADKSYKEMEGNQSFPSQVEVVDWQKVVLADSEGYYGTSKGLWFYLEKGSNTLTFEAVKDRMVVKSITVRPAEELVDYHTYLEQMEQAGAAYIDTAKVRIQAEDATLKSSPSLYPQNDRTSALTEPYDPTYIVLNTIGGSSWSAAGEWIEWEVEVPQAGLYRIATRYKQKESPGFSAVRSVSINGEVPFAEAENVKFDYSTSFQVEYMQSVEGEDLYFYLNEGTNTIRMTCALGDYADVAIRLQESIDELSAVYYSITAITSTSPTMYQDYQLTKRIPGLTDSLASIGEDLAEIRGMIVDITGGTTDVSASLERASDMLLEVAAKPSQITNKVTSMADSITSLGSAVLTLSQQALTLDWLELQGTSDTLSKAEGNFLQNLKHEVLSFVGSFTNDYNVAREEETDSKEQKTITVWISTGRDQMDVLRRLINESFATEYDISVDLKLVDAGIIMTAVAGGTGPDVAIGLSNTLPLELGYRGAAYDLSQFDDFEEVAAQFSEAAVECFEFDGAYYAIPDQMSFPVMFYRTDILAQYDIAVPETWDDLISVIPTMATYNMQAYLDRDTIASLGVSAGVGSSKAINSVYLSMLYQNGAELYAEDAKSTLLMESESIDCFEKWTDFYTKYGFSASIDFVTRFRLGSVPIAIMDISYYNRLSISAPEISGKWGIAMIPGTEQEDGSIDHSVPVSVSGISMIKSTVEREDTAQEAWEFIKWWVSADVQTGYAREMESVLGSSGRYMVANLESFEKVSWSAQVASVLEDCLPWLREVRQIPGSYLTGRNIENAFYAVINDTSLEPMDELAEQVEGVEREIMRKREEYGLETE